LLLGEYKIGEREERKDKGIGGERSEKIIV
jgi:hypothetical protein